MKRATSLRRFLQASSLNSVAFYLDDHGPDFVTRGDKVGEEASDGHVFPR